MLVSSSIRDITERKRADVLQRSFVPERLPAIPGVHLAARFVPGGTGVDVGGDWYDVLELDRRPDRRGDRRRRRARHPCRIADEPASQRPARLRVRSAIRPARRSAHLNSLAWRREGVVMATVIYLVLDPASGLVRLSSAGHPPPLRAGPDGTTEYLEEGRSLPLGVARQTKYTEAEYLLEPGSTLLLYTDGLIEKRSTPIDDGMRRARRGRRARTWTTTSSRSARRLLETVSGAADDVALLALRSVPVTAERMVLTLPAEPLELSSLRRALQRWLSECEASEADSYDIVLACNEACANAIEHAYGPGDASVHIDAAFSGHEVAITVRDNGQWREPRGDHRGRGLGLIETLMDSVHIATDPDTGTEVSMTRRLGTPMSTLEQLELEQRGNVVIAHVSGEVDLSNAASVTDRLIDATPNHTTVLVLDLSGTRYLDSSGVRMLFELAQRLRNRGQELQLVVPDDSHVGASARRRRAGVPTSSCGEVSETRSVRAKVVAGGSAPHA